MTVLRVPEGLDDMTPLPYELWQVVSLVDGHMSAAEVARLSGLSEEEVLSRLSRADAYVQQHQRLSRPLDDELYGQIKSALGQVIGPVASFALEDALADLGGREGLTVGALMRRLNSELDTEQRGLFVQTARKAGIV